MTTGRDAGGMHGADPLAVAPDVDVTAEVVARLDAAYKSGK